MTTAQLTTLKADLLSKSNTVHNGKTFFIHNSESNYKALADYYNSLVSPTQMIWRPNLPKIELSKQIVMSAFVSLTAVKQNGYIVLTQADTIDATDANIRASFSTIFGAGTTLNNLTAVAQRAATNFEFLFTTANVSTAYGIIVSEFDIEAAYKS